MNIVEFENTASSDASPKKSKLSVTHHKSKSINSNLEKHCLVVWKKLESLDGF